MAVQQTAAEMFHHLEIYYFHVSQVEMGIYMNQRWTNRDAFVKINVVHNVSYFKSNMFYSRVEGQASFSSVIKRTQNLKGFSIFNFHGLSKNKNCDHIL